MKVKYRLKCAFIVQQNNLRDKFFIPTFWPNFVVIICCIYTTSKPVDQSNFSYHVLLNPRRFGFPTPPITRDLLKSGTGRLSSLTIRIYLHRLKKFCWFTEKFTKSQELPIFTFTWGNYEESLGPAKSIF